MIETKIDRKELSAFHNLHHGETIIVCGCGESLNELAQPERFITIGVNDVGRRFTPNYLVVVNPRNQFTGDRFSYVENSQAEYLFTQLHLGLAQKNIVKFQLGSYGGTDFSNPNVLHHTQNSPYLAMCLAVHMGAKRIGLVGVDFTEHHFFAQTGVHSLSPQLTTINEQYKRLAEAIQARGIEVFNLSRTSRLTAFTKIVLEEFAARAEATPDSGNGAHARRVLAQPIFAPNGNGTRPNSDPAVTASIANLPPADAERAESRISDQARPRVFGVDYHFITCGDVFGTGLRNAAEDLGIIYEGAVWDDPQLADKIDRFRPDLIFIVHGRRFAQRWRNRFSKYHTAVWLVDEPYEVDDTVQWSRGFRTVFINDPSTLSRHHNAHYLPVAFDARLHRDPGLTRPHKVGFIGGYNNAREKCLSQLSQAGLLSYVVGGPWRSPDLRPSRSCS